MSRYKGDLLVLISTFCWGSSYSFIKIAAESLSSFNLMTIRFALAFAITGLLFNATLRRTGRGELGYGLLLGLTLFCGNGLLTFGLAYTTVSNAGFIVGTTVVFVALIQAVKNRETPRPILIAGLLLSVVGVAALTMRGAVGAHFGDILCLAGAVVFAAHIFVVQSATRRHDALHVCILQFGFTALFACLASFLFETPILPPSASAWQAVCVLAVFGSSIGFICQLVGQRFTTPTRTAFLFTLEPLFALFFAYLVSGEALTARTAIGGALLLAGIYVSEYKSGKAAAAVESGVAEEVDRVDAEQRARP